MNRYLIIVFCALAFVYSCKQEQEPVDNESSTREISAPDTTASVINSIPVDSGLLDKNQPEKLKGSNYQYWIFNINAGEKYADGGFGFEITTQKSSGMRIRQETIPAVQGNHPFLSQENAAATAKLMIYKLDHGIMPPAVSVEELDSIGVVY